MLELIPCYVRPEHTRNTTIRLLYIPGQLSDQLPVEFNSSARKLKDLRVSSNLGFLEFIVGLAYISEDHTEEVRLGYSIETEEWYLLVPINKTLCKMFFGKNIKDVYYAAFYDCLSEIVAKKSKGKNAFAGVNHNWPTIVEAVNKTRSEYKSREELRDMFLEKRYARKRNDQVATV